MIQTKFAILFFSILAFILFPFSFILSESDFYTSIIPGWHTTFSNGYLIATFIKFLLLMFAITGYWLLSKNNLLIKRKLVVLHALLSVPSVINAKFSLLLLVDFQSGNMEKINDSIETIVPVIVLMNIMFITGQVYFGYHFFKIRKTSR